MARVWIYESELRAIAQETAAWTCETGGDLFGLWQPKPVILLATRLGPESQRHMDRCRFDLKHVERLSRVLAVDWGLWYLGDWHSHGFSDWIYPSRTDRERMGRILERNHFAELLEFIATRHRPSQDMEARVAIHGYHFPAARWFDPTAVDMALLRGLSPLREELTRRSDDSFSQDWNAWKQFESARIDGFAQPEAACAQGRPNALGLPSLGEMQSTES